MLDRLCWAEISLGNYSRNLRSIKKIVGKKVKVAAIIKANAYGHGDIGIAKTAVRTGAAYLGVVCLFEAMRLRQAGISTPVLILNYTDADNLARSVENNITINVMEETLLKELDRTARKMGKIAKIHVKMDTGMHRMGLAPEEALRYIPKIGNCRNVFLEGIFTHFATADENDLSFTKEQNKVFCDCLEKLRRLGVNPPLVHAANSAASLRLTETHHSMVRPGIITYGLPPSGDFRLPFIPLPVLSLKTRIVQIRTVKKGETVGYGRTFTAANDTKVAVLPIGYADGFRRAPQNFGKVLVRGKYAPILGRVSMDQTSIDITRIPDAKESDEVVIIGKQGKSVITADEIAQQIGTINYEVTSALAPRVQRIYIS